MNSTGPSGADVELQFVRLLKGEASRDEVDRWAATQMADDVDIADDAVTTAVTRLHGVDLRHGPDMPYLHDDEQIAEWLADFRASVTPTPPA
ncbi:hypothetical protein ACIA8G_24295 [Lentzea sp. NPDC051213]|uniref:hypothetical protein n=1 Tax=Lentzea sp. NPDC051213 TaxID=3364126 RepID=UPI0037B087FC